MGNFEGKHFFSEEDKNKINSQVRDVYSNIIDGRMTKEEGKMHILGFVTKIVQTKYPGIDLEKTGLANKINRYASMKIRKLDEQTQFKDSYGKDTKRTIGLGEASGLGKINKVKNELKMQLRFFITNRQGVPSKKEMYFYLENYARSKGLITKIGYPEPGYQEEYRDLIQEVINEFKQSGLRGSLPRENKIPQSNVNIGKMLGKERAEKGKEMVSSNVMRGVVDAVNRGDADAEKRVKNLMEELQDIWDSVNS
jgi:hypothetical protein